MSKALAYRRLADVAQREAERRKQIYPYDVSRGIITMAEADSGVEDMSEIADILDWLADREIELIEDEDGFGGDN